MGTQANVSTQAQGYGLALHGFGLALQGFGSISAGRAARLEAELAQRGAEFRTKLLTQQSGQAIAASHVAAEEERRKARLVESRALAVAAARGGGADATGVEALIADIAAEGAYRSAVALYEGEERARQLRLQAAFTRFGGEVGALEGRMKESAQRTAGVGALLRGGSSLYLRYAQQDGPSGDAALLDGGDGATAYP